jgi:cobalt transporter subunit CbtA
MGLLQRIVLTAVLAGLIAGVVVAIAHHFGTVPMILQAEMYETSASEEPATWKPAEGFERTAYTVLADILTAIGTALLLLSAYVLSGSAVDWRNGLYWGLAGFAAFTLWPNLGLPPNLPGVPAAAHEARQIWWVITAVAAAVGLASIFLARRGIWVGMGILLLILPQLYGAPQPADYQSSVPASLVHRFIVASVLTNFLFWSLLGWLTGSFYKRLRLF